jgi:hypothetical protein
VQDISGRIIRIELAKRFKKKKAFYVYRGEARKIF